MRPIIPVTGVDLAFGNIANLPPKEDIPERFWSWSDPYHQLVSKWFFSGLTHEELGTPREGVDGPASLAAIKAIMVSFEPKHEHKTAGVAFLLHEWRNIPALEGK